MKKLGMAVFMIITAVVANSILFAQGQEGRKIESIEGRVVGTDWVGSAFTIRYLEGEDFSEAVFKVSDETRWEKQDYESPGLSDLESDDLVMVQYYVDPSGGKHAVEVKVITP